MGVPALFRWLSKKYPKIVKRVVEDTPTKVRQDDDEVVEVPIRYESANPNGFEVDNLYLDMNGIVHPCTHPEGKPAPETEEEMMVEIFKYTERVVNMARPRKVLMMAIDGVAPRAKMNQQRSRRFRAAQEAKEKEIERKEAIAMFEAMGHPVSEETRNQKTWDSNAITPGTPFMDLLSLSLKYWVCYKFTNDPGWRDLKVIISDASVPGEGEHKIVDWIRRQRTHSAWDPNTSHVMYGLDADLIMLSLATHEPHFRVLREDVFAQGSKGPQACKKCGQMGHYAANCKQEAKLPDPNVVEKATPVEPKPFIFLDVSVLREYLTVELNVATPFPFDLELAIDDWIFMIFFVGNDFLPHLPSLEIREGAIDVLLKIWKSELHRMGGYLTNHGKVDLSRAQVILEGLAKSEDEIFQKRKEDEDRQENRQKRQRIDDYRRQDEAAARANGGGSEGGKSMQLNGQEYRAVDNAAATARGGALHPSLPSRPTFDIVPKEETNAVPSKAKKMSASQREAAALAKGPDAILAMSGSNKDYVDNRKQIRLANLSAAQALKAELDGTTPKADSEETEEKTVTVQRVEDGEKEELTDGDAQNLLMQKEEDEGVNLEVTDDGIRRDEDEVEDPVEREEDASMDPSGFPSSDEQNEHGSEHSAEEEALGAPARGRGETKAQGSRKRKADDAELQDEMNAADDDDEEDPPNPEADQPVPKKSTLKVNADGTVDGYVDDVRLWEPGYRERYYKNKFGVDLGDRDFLDGITRSYMEGLCWVLEYYYQGVPAWDWYYPYHYAPFAQDFRDIAKMDIKFEVAQPFKPFAQLLGVFPAASRKHLPLPLQGLMINDDSPILDFYPEEFDIDMNGKKMAWQGVALLPFIDQTRLLAALKSKEDGLNDDEKRRNAWGDNVMFVSETGKLFDPFSVLYGLKPATQPIPLDGTLSDGASGSVLGDPACMPSSGLESPLRSIPECPDLSTNASLSVRYYFPRQAHKHRSVLLNGYRPESAVLSEGDKDWVRRGGPGAGRDNRGQNGGGRYGGGPGMGGGGGRGGGRHASGGYGNGHGNGRAHGNGGPGGYGNGNGGYPSARDMAAVGMHAAPPPPTYGRGPPPPQPVYGYGGGSGGYASAPPPPPPSYGGSGGGGYGGYGGYGSNGGGGGGGSYGGYGSTGGGGYGAPPPPHAGRNPYGAPPPPPPAAYGSTSSYGGGQGGGYGGGGYGGHGGQAGQGGYGGRGGGYNPYGAPPPRRY